LFLHYYGAVLEQLSSAALKNSESAVKIFEIQKITVIFAALIRKRIFVVEDKTLLAI